MTFLEHTPLRTCSSLLQTRLLPELCEACVGDEPLPWLGILVAARAERRPAAPLAQARALALHLEC